LGDLKNGYFYPGGKTEWLGYAQVSPGYTG